MLYTIKEYREMSVTLKEIKIRGQLKDALKDYRYYLMMSKTGNSKEDKIKYRRLANWELNKTETLRVKLKI